MTSPRKTLKWNTGSPPRRGVYQVRSEGPSPNAGYRYWHGPGWGQLWATRAQAIMWKNDIRRRRLTHQVLWASLVEATEPQSNPAIELLEHQLQLAKNVAQEQRERADRLKSCIQWLLDNPGAHPANREKVIKAAIGE